ncbi:MAG: diadenylate cyclase CdaA [Candidatus Abyssubacteria bacterium]
MSQFLSELLQTFRIADFFDIALISVMIYVLLIWFEATASRFVLMGILLLGLVYLIARFFNMYLSAMVLRAFFAILIIAMVVIFQEELRLFFERISLWTAIRTRSEKFIGPPEIDVLTRTLAEFARDRIGALVVLRGKDPLDRHLEGGIELDGLVSEALLKSIFDPHSLGHDGAVVIERGRVRKFACRLPLSSDVRKIGNLGTRHSAALGLAERSDALCLVVSEERGVISIARDEKLREIKDPARLQAAIERFYVEKFPVGDRKKWQEWVRENSRQKAVAIVLSCMLWFFFVYQTGTVRRDFIIPIEYRNLASNWIIEEPKPKQVTVTLLGRARAFDLLDAATLKATLDMANIKEGTQQISLTRDMVRRPSSLTVVEIVPETVTLSAYELVSFNLPVKVQTTGKLPDHLTLEKITVSPDSIPAKVSSRLQGGSLKVLTEPIDLRKLSESVTFTPTLILPEGVAFGDQKLPAVTVTVEVRKTETEKS